MKRIFQKQGGQTLLFPKIEAYYSRMDPRLKQVVTDLNEDPSTDLIDVVDGFLADRPYYTAEKLKSVFIYLNAIVDNNGKVNPKDYNR